MYGDGTDLRRFDERRRRVERPLSGGLRDDAGERGLRPVGDAVARHVAGDLAVGEAQRAVGVRIEPAAGELLESLHVLRTNAQRRALEGPVGLAALRGERCQLPRQVEHAVAALGEIGGGLLGRLLARREIGHLRPGVELVEQRLDPRRVVGLAGRLRARHRAPECAGRPAARPPAAGRSAASRGRSPVRSSAGRARSPGGSG